MNFTQRIPTPCIGICSTTYGDDVCKGCKRFIHEIIDWNGYEAEEKQIIWQRLIDVTVESVQRYLIIDNPEKLIQILKAQGIHLYDFLPEEYHVLTLFRAIGAQTVTLRDFGIERLEIAKDMTALELGKQINQDILDRAEAQYDINYGRARRLIQNWDD